MKSHDLARKLLSMDDREVMTETWDGAFAVPMVQLQEVFDLPRGTVEARDKVGQTCGTCGYPTATWAKCSKCGYANPQPKRLLIVVLR